MKTLGGGSKTINIRGDLRRKREKPYIKPALPYEPGTRLEARVHNPPDSLPDRLFSSPPESFYEEKEKRTPEDLCFSHYLANGSRGKGVVRLKTIAKIRAGDNLSSQVVKISIVSSRPANINGIKNSQELVAKIYDPLYRDFELGGDDIFRNVDAQYRHEAKAYQQLEPVWSSIVPRFYGSYTADITMPSSNIFTSLLPRKREVRLLLLEYIRGESLGGGRLHMDRFTEADRKSIALGVILAVSEIRKCNVVQQDLHPRNVILVHDSEGGKLRMQDRIRLIDFDFARCNVFTDEELIPDKEGPKLYPDKMFERWRTENSPQILERFGDWFSGWDWDDWLRTEFPRPTDAAMLPNEEVTQK
ncbi:MAG: hypothetical protein Q9162_007281 [Coniocarpon cinnabarinum]